LLFRSLVDFGSFIRLNLKENQFTGGIEVFFGLMSDLDRPSRLLHEFETQ